MKAVVFILILLSAPQAYSEDPLFKPMPQTAEECEMKSGAWRLSSGSKPWFYCADAKTTDGGKECTDTAQCQGLCVPTEAASIDGVERGHCSQALAPPECGEYVSNGHVAEYCMCE